MSDCVKDPAHYAGDGIVDCRRAQRSMVSGVGFNPPEGTMLCHLWLSAFEYLWRWPHKNEAGDLMKCRELIGSMIGILEGEDGADER